MAHNGCITAPVYGFMTWEPLTPVFYTSDDALPPV